MMVKICYDSLCYIIYEKIDAVMLLPFEMVKDRISGYGSFLLPRTAGIGIIRAEGIW